MAPESVICYMVGTVRSTVLVGLQINALKVSESLARMLETEILVRTDARLNTRIRGILGVIVSVFFFEPSSCLSDRGMASS
jgi:hypothetical protein